jgi:DNA-binding NtrC family response regulator
MTALAGLKILLVEDEMLVSLIIEDLLADQQCLIVGPFDEVPSALAAALTEDIDAAVLDVNVKGVKIYPVADALAERRIPFLFLSGYGDHAIPPDHPDWIACEKPFKAELLLSKLAQCILARHAQP